MAVRNRHGATSAANHRHELNGRSPGQALAFASNASRNWANNLPNARINKQFFSPIQYDS